MLKLIRCNLISFIKNKDTLPSPSLYTSSARSHWLRVGMFLISIGCLVKFSFADCLFRIVNYSSYPIVAKVGFYGGSSKILNVGGSVANTMLIANQYYQCVGVKPDGAGAAYIDLVGNDSVGGWRYIPVNTMIRGVGKTAKGGDFVIGVVDSGRVVALMNNYKPESDIFEVQIKPARFRDTKNSSSN